MKRNKIHNLNIPRTISATMESRNKKILFIIILIISLLAWAPWITDDYVLKKVKINSNFIRQHTPYGGIQDSEINVFWLPFGRGVTTYEGIWYVPFFGSAI